jgi:hypothetical protein
MLNEVLRQVLWPLTGIQNVNAEIGYYNVLGSDGNFRHCKPAFAAWLAEYPEYCKRHHLKRLACFWCKCPKNELGDYVPSDKQYPRSDHNLYGTLSDANTKADDAERSSRHVNREFDVFRYIPRIVSDLPKPDLLHSMHISMLDHLQM